MPDFTEPFYGCRVCGDPNNHSNQAHSEALGCSCTRVERDPNCPMLRFNAAEIITEAREKHEDPFTALVYQSVGAASSCWANLKGAGVFDDRLATHVAKQLIEGLRQLPAVVPGRDDVEGEIRAVLNRYSAESPSGTPDFVLATYLIDCLKAFNEAVSARAEWRDEPVEFRPKP